MSWRDEIRFYIREERERKGMSQEELGYYSGVHRTYIGAVERGEKNLTMDMLEKIATGLGIKFEDLFKISKD